MGCMRLIQVESSLHKRHLKNLKKFIAVTTTR